MSQCTSFMQDREGKRHTKVLASEKGYLMLMDCGGVIKGSITKLRQEKIYDFGHYSG
jgi:hypothetical protein